MSWKPRLPSIAVSDSNSFNCSKSDSLFCYFCPADSNYSCSLSKLFPPFRLLWIYMASRRRRWSIAKTTTSKVRLQKSSEPLNTLVILCYLECLIFEFFQTFTSSSLLLFLALPTLSAPKLFLTDDRFMNNLKPYKAAQLAVVNG